VYGGGACPSGIRVTAARPGVVGPHFVRRRRIGCGLAIHAKRTDGDASAAHG